MIDALYERKKTVSVIIPAFNRENSVGRAIASVQGLPTGSYEVIVIDDGSSDKTADKAQEVLDEVHPGAGRVLRQMNAGPGAARNFGAKVARGHYLAFLDSDDFWFPRTRGACFDALNQVDVAEPALVFLQTLDVTDAQETKTQDDGVPSILRFEGFLEAVEAVPSTRYGSCNVVVRRDVYEAIGGFTTEVRCSEDTDLFLRAAASGPCLVMSGVPLIAHVDGPGDRLTAHFPEVLAGYEFLLSRQATGVYPDAPGEEWLKDSMLAKCAAHTILTAFAAGHQTTAFRLYLDSFSCLWRAGNWHWLIRLPLVPLLAFLRPSSYRMRWTKSD